MKHFTNITRVDSTEGNVAKFVYTNDTSVAESVLYKYPTYEERTVICCSTMSGCPVGCRFCGAGDNFVRSLTSEEIVEQAVYSVEQTGVEDPDKIGRLQIMFMSMGEPMLNSKHLKVALRELYRLYPNAALLISTIGPDVDYEWLHELSVEIPTIGLQFSIHEPTDARRDKLIPFDKKLNIEQISQIGQEWFDRTGRKPFFNYCAGEDNSSEADAQAIAKHFNPMIWNATVSVICERNEGMPAKNDYQINLADNFSQKLLALSYDVRVFDPAGQDDIGGGCGQLWFVQDWMKNNPDKARPSVGNGLPKVHTPHLEKHDDRI